MGGPVSGVAVFNYALWIARFPEFAAVPEALAELYFAEAGVLYLNNTSTSRIQSLLVRQSMLNLITAHLAKLGQIGPDGQPLNPLVGRISDAAEGSVNVTAELKIESQAAQFWIQTQYGLMFWQATAQYRTAVYRAAPPYRFGPDWSERWLQR